MTLQLKTNQNQKEYPYPIFGFVPLKVLISSDRSYTYLFIYNLFIVILIYNK